MISNAALVAALREQHPEIQTRRFLLALRQAFPDVAGDEPINFNRVPDGYVIRKDAREVDIFEAEATHPLGDHAIRDICRLWFDLDSEGIALSLFVVSHFGHINQVDLQAWHYRRAA